MIQEILSIILGLLGQLGTLAIFLIVMLEYAAFPISSEVILPFLGVMIYNNVFSYGDVIFFSISGGIVGSIIGYIIGSLGGEKILKECNKRNVRIKNTIEEFNFWFYRYREKAVCICRILPMTRNLISMVAGKKRIDLKSYIAYSSLGITIWNVSLVVLGYFIGYKINTLEGAFEKCYFVGYFSLIITLIYFFYGKFKNKKAQTEKL